MSSPLAEVLSRVGDRWSLQLIEALGDRPLRFAELHAAVAGIATNVLSQRLRALERDRLLVASPYSRRPVRYSYELTEDGRALLEAARLLATWGAQRPAHATCGTPLTVRWWCPTCEQPGDGPEADVWL